MDNVTLIEKLFVCLFHYPLRAHCHCPRPVFMNGSGGGVVVCGGACDGDGIGGGQVTACPDHSPTRLQIAGQL